MADTGRVVVVGAGVVGLTCARVLAENRYQVTVVAKSMPGDTDGEYASPWAGANFLPFAAKDTPESRYEAQTYPYLHTLATTTPAAGIHLQNTLLFNRTKDIAASGPTATWFAGLLSTNPWWKDVVRDFRVLGPDDLPAHLAPGKGGSCAGVDCGTGFTSVCINVPVYLSWLQSRCLELGVTFRRATLGALAEAAGLHSDAQPVDDANIHRPPPPASQPSAGRPADIVINCTALGSATLADVKDEKLIPARGQIALVSNNAPAMISVSGCDDADDETCYIMQRAAGGGTVIGGCYQKGDTNTAVDEAMGKRILRRAVEVCPELIKGREVEGWKALDVIRWGVGLRPVREGGIRIEGQDLGGKEGSVKVVHCYGHGGYGYQSSYGSTLEVLRLVNESLGSASDPPTKPPTTSAT